MVVSPLLTHWIYWSLTRTIDTQAICRCYMKTPRQIHPKLESHNSSTVYNLCFSHPIICWILTQSTTVTPTCLDQNRIIMGRPKQALLANVICEMCVLSRISLLLRHQWDWGAWSIEANNDKVNRIYWFCINANNDKILPKCRLAWNQSL